MQAIWTRLHHWLSIHWSAGLQDLNPPASNEDIEQLEAALGLRLPADFAACLRVHDGQKAVAGGLFDGTEFLSTATILEQWQVWKQLLDDGHFVDTRSEPDPGVRDDWWNAAWIPFTYNGAGDHLCLDLAPAPGGTHGQVITMWHDMGDRRVEAADFASWFAACVDGVEAGRYVYSEEYGGLVSVDDL